MLEKISNNNFKVYIAELNAKELDFVHFKLSRGEYVADVKRVEGKTSVIGCSNKTVSNVGNNEFDKVKSELLFISKEYNINNADKDGYFVILNENVKSKI